MATWWMVEGVEDVAMRESFAHESVRHGFRAGLGAERRAYFREELVRIYTAKDPTKLENVDRLVEKYEGFEEEFLQALKERHGLPDQYKPQVEREAEASPGPESIQAAAAAAERPTFSTPDHTERSALSIEFVEVHAQPRLSSMTSPNDSHLVHRS